MTKRKVLTERNGNCPLPKFPRPTEKVDPKVLGGRGLVGNSKALLPLTTKKRRRGNLPATGRGRATRTQLNGPCNNAEYNKKWDKNSRQSYNVAALATGPALSRSRHVRLPKEDAEEIENTSVVECAKLENDGNVETKKEQWKPTVGAESRTNCDMSRKEYLDENPGPSFRTKRHATKSSHSRNEIHRQQYHSSDRKRIPPSENHVHGSESENELREYSRNTVHKNYTIGGEMFCLSASIDGSEITESTPSKFCDKNSARPPPLRNHAANTRRTLSDFQVQVWSVEDQNSSSPLYFKIGNRTYVHPPLPPGWEIIVSETQKKPFYVHPDFGATWHCPVILPRKLPNRNCGNVDGEQNGGFASTYHLATKRKQSSQVNTTLNSERLLELETSMSQLLTCCDSGGRAIVAAAFHDSSPNSGCGLKLEQETHDDAFDGHGHGREVQTQSTVRLGKDSMEKSKSEGSLFDYMQSALATSSRLQPDKSPLSLSPCLQHTPDSYRSKTLKLETNKMATDTEAKKNHMGTARGPRGSIFRHASKVDSKLQKVRTASTESSSMSEISSSTQTDRYSDRGVIRSGPPGVSLSAVASTCYSTFQNSSLNQKGKVQQNEIQTTQLEKLKIATSCERIQIEKSESVMNLLAAPSAPPLLRMPLDSPTSNEGKLGVCTELQHSANRHDLFQEVGQDIESNLECNLAKPSVRTPASTSDRSEKNGERSADKAFTSQSKSMSPNQPASPSTHSPCFDFDHLGNSPEMEGQAASCITNPGSNCSNDAAESLSSDSSGDLVERTAVYNGPDDSPSIQSSCEVDFSNSDIADEGLISPSKSSRTDQCSIQSSRGKAYHEASEHSSCNSATNGSPSTLLASKTKGIRRRARRREPRRWEIHNPPMCSLMRLGGIHEWKDC